MPPCRHAAMQLIHKEAYNRPVMSSYNSVIDYCHALVAHSNIERFHVLYLDRSNSLIADEELQHGTVDHCPLPSLPTGGGTTGYPERRLCPDHRPQSPLGQSNPLPAGHRDDPTGSESPRSHWGRAPRPHRHRSRPRDLFQVRGPLVTTNHKPPIR